MIELGKKQILKVVKKVDFGVYLAEEEGSTDKVLLPKKQVPEGAENGTEIEVFIYRDSKERLIATTTEPKLTLGEFGVLTVKEVGKIGAFLDCGLEKDLFLPFKQQTRKVRPGDEVLVAMYIDKSSRLCATMNVYQYLKTDSPYAKNDMVKGVIYEISKNFGAFVAVDYQYSALIPAKEFHGEYEVGDEVEARVAAVKADGKLDLSIRRKAHQQMDEDAQYVMQVIDEFEGVLPFNDKVSPEIIQREFKMSKNAFKRAVGKLYKEGKIEITENRILKVK